MRESTDSEQLDKLELVTYCFLKSTDYSRKEISVFRNGQLRSGQGGLTCCSNGFSLLELIIVIVIISVLMVLAISRLVALQVDAERVTMNMVTGTLRSAIGMKVAESIIKSEVKALAAYEGSNPMSLLAEAPHNYLGELDGVDPASLENGNWYFDKRERTLVYLVRHKAFFVGGQVNPPRVRFRVTVVYSDRNGNGFFDPGIDKIEGLRLAPMDKYSWSQS